MELQPYGDNFIPVILVDYREHTDEKPFCWDATCDCHDDQDAINQVAGFVADRLMTPEEATDFVKGRGI